MLWLLWLVWFLYCIPVAPTWCYVFVALRPTRGRFVAWAIASGLALVWFAFVPQHRRWQRREAERQACEAERRANETVGDEIEREFKSLYG